MRVGIGFDTHKFLEGRPLIIGGIEIPAEKGLAGHSDADVLVHAIIDAMLGACGAGDIGEYFPDTDPKHKDASSIKLLRKIRDIVADRGYKLINVDAVIITEFPKINLYRKKMLENISDALQADVERINLKGTTTEGLGYTGRQEGIASYAVVLLDRF